VKGIPCLSKGNKKERKKEEKEEKRKERKLDEHGIQIQDPFASFTSSSIFLGFRN